MRKKKKAQPSDGPNEAKPSAKKGKVGPHFRSGLGRYQVCVEGDREIGR